MVEERLADRGDAVVRERRRQVGPGDLGPDRSRDRRDGYGAVSHAPTLLRCRFGEMLAQLERRDESRARRSEEHTSELQSLMRISYAVFCLKKNKNYNNHSNDTY